VDAVEEPDAVLLEFARTTYEAAAMTSADPVDPNLASMLSNCTVSRSWAEQDRGPYHRDAQPVRRDITEDRDGVSLQLGIRLAEDNGRPVADAAIEVWQCDALGRYSGFPPADDSAVVTAVTAPRAAYLPGETFLRGTQRTDADGMAEFHTIYPGWYPGRTVHIHLIVAADGHVRISQLYLPEPVNHDVLARPPYAHRPGRDTTNATDTIFPTGGDAAVVDVQPVGDGYRAALCLVLPSGP
jgi:protocatechuate 3,4-dioxygenase beta subunit